MLIRKLNDCPEIIAGDKTILRELFHPDRDYQFSGRYSLAHAIVEPRTKSVPHILKSSEVYYIIRGEGIMHINDETEIVKAGDALEIPPGAVQSIENQTDVALELLCIVDPAWKTEDEEIL